MAFTVQDFSDLTRLLAEHPEWQAELRRLLLADDFLALPGIVRELVEAQQRTDETVRHLVEAQQRSEERLARAEERLDRLETTVALLVEVMQSLTDKVASLIDTVAGLTDTLGGIKGRVLELDYRDKAGAFFGPLLRRLRVVAPITLEDELEAHLSHEEFRDVLLLDVLISGRPRHLPEAPEVWLAVEVASVVNGRDVARARRRAELLRRAGYRAIPAVAGEKTTPEVEDEARQYNVVVLQDGRADFWEEALKAAAVE